jgi:hypothetical protein
MFRRTLDLSWGRAAQPPPNQDAAARPHPDVLRGIANAEALRVPSGAAARPVQLPLQLRMFSRVPVVVSARLHGSSGKPAEPFARLYLAS